MKRNGSEKMTAAEKIALLFPDNAEDALETVKSALQLILYHAAGFYDDDDALAKHALSVAAYAVYGVDQGGVDEDIAREILSHLESLATDMADLKGLTPATRARFEAIQTAVTPPSR